jgi:hypothetical protein
MVGAQAVALAAGGLIFLIVQARPPAAPPVKPAVLLVADSGSKPFAKQPPYSCQLFHAEQLKCAFGACDARALDRLKRACLRDGGQPLKGW